MATYLIFALFYALYLFLSQKQRELKSSKNILLLFLMLVFLVFLFLAATRGAFLGLVGSTFVFLCYVAFANKEWRKRLLGPRSFWFFLSEA